MDTLCICIWRSLWQFFFVGIVFNNVRSGQRSVYQLDWRIVGVARWNREKKPTIQLLLNRFVSIAMSLLPYQFLWRSLQNAQFWSSKFLFSCPFFPMNSYDGHSKMFNFEVLSFNCHVLSPINFYLSVNGWEAAKTWSEQKQFQVILICRVNWKDSYSRISVGTLTSRNQMRTLLEKNAFFFSSLNLNSRSFKSRIRQRRTNCTKLYKPWQISWILDLLLSKCFSTVIGVSSAYVILDLYQEALRSCGLWCIVLCSFILLHSACWTHWISLICLLCACSMCFLHGWKGSWCLLVGHLTHHHCI